MYVNKLNEVHCLIGLSNLTRIASVCHNPSLRFHIHLASLAMTETPIIQVSNKTAESPSLRGRLKNLKCILHFKRPK